VHDPEKARARPPGWNPVSERSRTTETLECQSIQLEATALGARNLVDADTPRFYKRGFAKSP
jgi:hypothetical protein